MSQRFSSAPDHSHIYAPLSDVGNRPPSIRWEMDGDRRIMANPKGARIVIDWVDELSANVSVLDERSPDGDVVARVRAYLCGHTTDIGEEACQIAAALYWSWWRSLDMHGEAP